MNDLFDVSNPDEKINIILKEAVKTRQGDIKTLHSEIDSIEKQEADDIIFTPLSKDPEDNLTPQYVASAVATLIGDTLMGFHKGVQKIKEDADASADANANADADAEQRGGKVNATKADKNKADKTKADKTKPSADKNKADKTGPSADNIKTQADNLAQLMEKAAQKAKQIAKETTQNIKSSSSSLGVDNRTALQDSYSKVSKLGHEAFKTGLLWTEKFINMMVDLSLDSLGQGDINNTSWEKLSPELNKKVVLFAGVLKELSENPATREAVKEIAQAVAISMLEIMEEIKPELNKITDEALEMLDEMATKSVKGATRTAMGVAQSFIAVIPWIGGMINFVLAIGKGFNALMEVYKIYMYRSTDMGIQGVETYIKTENTINKGKNRIEGAYDDAMNKIKESQNKIGDAVAETKSKIPTVPKIDVPKIDVPKIDVPKIDVPKIDVPKIDVPKIDPKLPTVPKIDPKIPTVPKTSVETKKEMKGGKDRFIPNKNIGNKIIKGGKRLHKTMKLFHKTVPRIKFTHRNKIYKHHKNRKSRRNKQKYTRKL